MVASIRNRGPDSRGVWQDREEAIGLGHARLSIIDLSEMGHQPMVSVCGRYVIVYNGEIYNFQAIAEDLKEEGCRFRGNADTEVLLTAIAQWGIDAAVERLIGMFAFAVWDRERKEVTLCRDRLGIKPLYYGIHQGVLVFGSELKPFREVGGFDLSLNRDALTLLLRHNYIPTPHSVYEKVHKLRPGHLLTLKSDEVRASNSGSSRSFWSAKSVVETRGGGLFGGSADEAVDSLETLLADAVGARMIADVPLGAFLSGGIDSSVVVALMQAQSSKPVKTFTIGLSEEGFNEATHAKAVAEHLGTDHTELYVTTREAQSVIPDLASVYDEPFSDSSQIPTVIVSQLARESVTVALSGDGGDELFGGYNRYDMGHRVWSKFSRMPRIGRSAAYRLLRTLNERQWDSLFGMISPVLPAKARIRMPGYRAHKLAEVIRYMDPERMYRELVSHWKHPEDAVIGGREHLTNLTDPAVQLDHKIDDFRERMMYLDSISYMPDDILTKVDRASMFVGLEARVPILDHRVFEFAWTLPLDYKIRNGKGKWVLREVLGRYVPEKLFERPKMGFGIPVGVWLREGLRDWAEDLLDPKKLEEQGLVEAEPVRNLWKQHLAGTADYQYLLWDILMLQSWLRSQ
jgi:asparagine synthase (glutamine-hydrolysing)